MSKVAVVVLFETKTKISEYEMEEIRKGTKAYVEAVGLPAQEVKLANDGENTFSHIHNHSPSNTPCSICQSIATLEI